MDSYTADLTTAKGHADRSLFKTAYDGMGKVTPHEKSVKSLLKAEQKKELERLKNQKIYEALLPTVKTSVENLEGFTGLDALHTELSDKLDQAADNAAVNKFKEAVVLLNQVQTAARRDPTEQSQKAVHPLNPGSNIVKRRENRAVTERPVIATAKTGVGHAHYAAKNNQNDRQQRRDERQCREQT